MPPSKKKNAGLTYDLLYDVLDIKRSTYREWIANVMPNRKWKVLSSDILLFIRILRDSIKYARMLPSEMHINDWDVVYDKVDKVTLIELREYNLVCNTIDGSVKLKHRSEAIPIKRGLSLLPFSDLVDEHLLGLSNMGSDRPNNVSLFGDRSEQYFEQQEDNEEVG